MGEYSHGLTVVVDSLAFTTPCTSLDGSGGLGGIDGVKPYNGVPGSCFGLLRRVHHSAPTVHSL